MSNNESIESTVKTVSTDQINNIWLELTIEKSTKKILEVEMERTHIKQTGSTTASEPVFRLWHDWRANFWKINSKKHLEMRYEQKVFKSRVRVRTSAVSAVKTVTALWLPGRTQTQNLIQWKFITETSGEKIVWKHQTNNRKTFSIDKTVIYSLNKQCSFLKTVFQNVKKVVITRERAREWLDMAQDIALIIGSDDSGCTATLADNVYLQ